MAVPPFPTLGIRANFLGIRKEVSSFARSGIAVLPAPYEHTVSYGGGTSRGPAAILRASRYVEFYDAEFGRELCHDVGVATLAPLDFRGRVHGRALELIERTVSDLLNAGKFVVTLGGEHTVSLAPVRAHFARYPDLCILQFDAHSDLRDSYQGSRYSHASVMARVAEVIDPRRIIQVGIRAQCIEEAQFIRERGVTTLYAHEIRRHAYPAAWHNVVLSRLTPHVYVTFDVDGFDPSLMPSTGTPEPNGLHWAETIALLRKVAERSSIVGCDVVELSPVRGVTHADMTAATLTYKLMNCAFLKR